MTIRLAFGRGADVQRWTVRRGRLSGRPYLYAQFPLDVRAPLFLASRANARRVQGARRRQAKPSSISMLVRPQKNLAMKRGGPRP
jgi:hypothetical protein